MGGKKMGRPPIEFNWRQLELLCQRKMTLVDCAEIMGVNPSTIDRNIKKKYACTFAEYRNKKMAKTRLSLIERALKMSETNTTMLIFCLKNLCGWADNPGFSEDDEQSSLEFV